MLVGRIVADGEVDWTAGYSSTGGGSTTIARRVMRGNESVAGLFKDFHYLVVEERLDPEVVHRAFLAIDESAELFNA